MFSKLHRQALAEFRGYREPGRSPEPRRAGDLVETVLNRLGLGERLKEGEVLGAWREIVGEFLAQHSSPVSLKRGVLQVQVVQPTVHYELDRVWKAKILAGFQERFGKSVVREIRFRC